MPEAADDSPEIVNLISYLKSLNQTLGSDRQSPEEAVVFATQVSREVKGSLSRLRGSPKCSEYLEKYVVQLRNNLKNQPEGPDARIFFEAFVSFLDEMLADVGHFLEDEFGSHLAETVFSLLPTFLRWRYDGSGAQEIPEGQEPLPDFRLLEDFCEAVTPAGEEVGVLQWWLSRCASPPIRALMKVMSGWDSSEAAAAREAEKRGNARKRRTRFDEKPPVPVRFEPPPRLRKAFEGWLSGLKELVQKRKNLKSIFDEVCGSVAFQSLFESLHDAKHLRPEADALALAVLGFAKEKFGLPDRCDYLAKSVAGSRALEMIAGRCGAQPLNEILSQWFFRSESDSEGALSYPVLQEMILHQTGNFVAKALISNPAIQRGHLTLLVQHWDFAKSLEQRKTALVVKLTETVAGLPREEETKAGVEAELCKRLLAALPGKLPFHNLLFLRTVPGRLMEMEEAEADALPFDSAGCFLLKNLLRLPPKAALPLTNSFRDFTKDRLLLRRMATDRAACWVLQAALAPGQRTFTPANTQRLARCLAEFAEELAFDRNGSFLLGDLMRIAEPELKSQVLQRLAHRESELKDANRRLHSIMGMSDFVKGRPVVAPKEISKKDAKAKLFAGFFEAAQEAPKETKTKETEIKETEIKETEIKKKNKKQRKSEEE